MSLVGSNALAGASGQGSSGYEIERSLRFNDDDSAYLSQTPSSAGNRKTWTWSCWVKRGDLSATSQHIFGNYYNSANDGFNVRFSSDTLNIFDLTSGNFGVNLVTDRVFRDPSAWYHLVIVFDTTQSTSTDRVKLYVNGVQETSFSTATYPSQNTDYNINTTNLIAIGRGGSYDGQYFDGYLADIHFVDGQALAASDFGEYDDNNVWQPKKYAGSYGTNGFHLDFSDNSSDSVLGTDSSGNSNDWTVNNLTADVNRVYNHPGWASNGSNWSVSNSNQDANYSGSSSYSTQLATALSNNTTYHFLLEQYAGSGDSYGGWFFSTDSSEGGTVPNELDGDTLGMRVGRSTIGAHGSYATANGVSSGSEALSGFSNIQANTSGGAATTTEFVINTTVDKVWVRPVGGSWIGGGDPSNTSSTASFNIVSDSTQYFAYIAYNSGTYAKFKTSVGDASTIDYLRDSPTNGDTANDTGAGGEVSGNYCTLNPLDRSSSITLANGNLDASVSGVSWISLRGTIGVSSGKWYWETKINTSLSSSNTFMAGIGTAQQSLTSYMSNTAGAGYYAVDGNKYPSIESYGAAYTNGDVIGIALDMDAGTLTFYKNGVSQGQSHSGLTGTWFPCSAFYGTVSISTNFGQRPFAYTAPSGYKALCTANLPDPTIEDGSTAFDAKLWTGNGSTQNITGYSFSPDLVWTKQRNSAGFHALFDPIRGVHNALRTHSAGGTYNDNGLLTAFNSDGFSVGSAGDINNNNSTYVGFAWDAGSSTVSNTDGTITSQVRANQTAGFSIVKYTGSGSTGTVGHGLNDKPAMIILKDIDDSANWKVLHVGAVDGSEPYYKNVNYLNDTTYFPGSGNTFPWGGTEPTNSVFSVSNIASQGDRSASLSRDYIAYCFAAVEGYSKFGSFESNNSADGPFVYTGFTPRWVLIKHIDISYNWLLWDTVISPFNVMDDVHIPNETDAEQTGSGYNFDVVSNGFKIRNNYMQGSNQTLIYAAFAEHPFKTARAR